MSVDVRALKPTSRNRSVVTRASSLDHDAYAGFSLWQYKAARSFLVFLGRSLEAGSARCCSRLCCDDRVHPVLARIVGWRLVRPGIAASQTLSYTP